ncbi:MAG: hypothetical protein U0325_33020 [Polyangiales bacterium]
MSAGRSASTLALKHGVHHAATRLGAAGLKHFVGGAGGTLAAFAVVEQSIDTVQIARGRIDRQEYAARTLENVGAFGAGYGGAVAGAALGSAVPVLGTAVGAVVGGLVGSLGGARLARVAVRAASRHEARMASPRRGVPGVNADAAPAEAPTEAPTE